jgi:hypothetical protein
MRMPNSPSSKRRGAEAPAAGAETLALQALTFLAEDVQRIQRFMQLTGTAPEDLPALAPRRAFLLAVLDHLAADEALLLAFAQELRLKPETIAAARRALGGVEAD